MTEKTKFDFKQLQDKIYVFTYRPRFRVVEDYVLGEDLQTVKKQCIDYCNRFGLTFVSVRPFFLDLDQKPRDQLGMQQQQEEVKSA